MIKRIVEISGGPARLSVKHRQLVIERSGHPPATVPCEDIARMTAELPDEGEVRFMVITDKQFGKIQTYWGKGRQPEEKSPSQLQFF